MSTFNYKVFSKKFGEVEVFLHYNMYSFGTKLVLILAICKMGGIFEPVMLLRDFCDFKSDLRDFAFQPLCSALHSHILQKKPHFCGIYP